MISGRLKLESKEKDSGESSKQYLQLAVLHGGDSCRRMFLIFAVKKFINLLQRVVEYM